MADEDEALFAAEVAADQLAPADVEVVGRLVDEKKTVLPREEQRQQQLGLLALGERVEAPQQQLLVQFFDPAQQQLVVFFPQQLFGRKQLFPQLLGRGQLFPQQRLFRRKPFLRRQPFLRRRTPSLS